MRCERCGAIGIVKVWGHLSCGPCHWAWLEKCPAKFAAETQAEREKLYQANADAFFKRQAPK